MYKLNEAHLATACIRDLVGLRSKLVEAIRQDMATWEQAPLHASLFGSVARDGGTRESDIDLLIVRPADVSAEDDRWREQVDRLSERIFGWTGNHTGVSEIDPDDLQNPDRGPSSGALREARRDGIQLAGMSLGRLLMGPAE
jgi:predicted nucleotidyltransferase